MKASTRIAALLIFLITDSAVCLAQASDLGIRNAPPALGSIPGARYGRVVTPTHDASVVRHPSKERVERAFISVTVPPLGDSISIDVAELVLTVSTVWDTTEPLVIAVYPATMAGRDLASVWTRDWAVQPEGYDPGYVGIAKFCETQPGAEIRFDVTEIVRRWCELRAPNFGFVLKSHSENKSTFHWVRDGRYEGADAKLEILYSRI